ncbi:MAG TPA: ATP-dependent zinc metalloprotease FtsH [Clostridia bacterium]|nr:ATP-dependent zinc metalloprotease FtsH [Clostridia bacterium]
MNSSGRKTLLISAIIIMVIMAIVLATTLNAVPEIPFDGAETSLVEKLKANEIATLYIDGNYKVKIEYRVSTLRGEDAFCYIDDREKFIETYNSIYTANPGLAKAELRYNNPSTSSTLMSMIIPLISIVLLLIFFVFLFKQSSGGNNKALSFGKTKANLAQNIKVRFADVAGAEEEKAELQEIVDFLKDSKRFIEMGARIPKGVLLVGPPGTGKTLFAKAVAGEASVPFFSISGSDFVEMFVGVGASRVRDLFEQAKKVMPCIVFIDEIDAVGRQRGAGLGGGNDEREQTLNQLLVQMDGFDTHDSIIIMAATNRSDILDPALLRPGRFDRQIYVNIPDVKGREAIFRVHSRNKPLSPDINFKSLARLTAGFTGADIENLLNEAAIFAVRDSRKLINMHDIAEAINKVIAGPAKKSRLVTETDKRITAYHESGHAIAARMFKYCDEVHEVSIIPRGMAAGYTITLPENDDSHISFNKLNDTIAMMLAGRAAEEIVIHDISTGASNDIQRASSIARKMVTEWGMSKKIGNMYLGASQEVFLGRDYQTQLTYSEKTASQIDEEVRTIMEDNYQRALTILRENRTVLDKMVKVLYEKETIYAHEVDMLFEGKEVKDIIALDNSDVGTNARFFETKKKAVSDVEEKVKNAESPLHIEEKEKPTAVKSEVVTKKATTAKTADGVKKEKTAKPTEGAKQEKAKTTEKKKTAKSDEEK